jgi:hypothetical protein
MPSELCPDPDPFAVTDTLCRASPSATLPLELSTDWPSIGEKPAHLRD